MENTQRRRLNLTLTDDLRGKVDKIAADLHFRSACQVAVSLLKIYTEVYEACKATRASAQELAGEDLEIAEMFADLASACPEDSDTHYARQRNNHAPQRSL